MVVNLPINWYYHLGGKKRHHRKIPGGLKMKKYIMILISCLLLFGCSSNNATSNEKQKGSSVQTEEATNKPKTFSQQEEAFITNSDGEKIYSLTIDSVKEYQVGEEYQEYVPSNSAQTVVITYTYKFIKKDSDDMNALYISPLDLTLFDETNLAGNFIDLAASDYPFDADSPELQPNRSARSYYLYSLQNKSEEVTIDFSSQLYDQQLSFKIPVESN